jgi:autotransporter-associated beta strand protein/predicted outer membrane repeat protein
MKPAIHHPLAACAFATALLLSPVPAPAQQITVSTGSGNGAGTLREAVATIASGGTIAFDTALERVYTSGTGYTITNKTLTLIGLLDSGTGVPALDAGNGSRHFVAIANSNPCELTLENLQLINGRGIANAENVGSAAYGGSIYMNNNLANPTKITLDNVLFDRNSAGNSGGTIYLRNGLANTGTVIASLNQSSITNSTSTSDGGALFAYGNGAVKITINGGSFLNNTASRGGGVIRAHSNKQVEISITDAFFSGNRSNGYDNVATHSGGVLLTPRTNTTVAYTVSLVSSTFTNNVAGHASGRGGVLAVGSDSATDNGTARVQVSATDNVFSQNFAFGYGGAFYARESDMTFAATQNAIYEGNFSGSNTAAGAKAQNGGFWYGASGGAGNTLNFNVGAGATLTIGSAANANRALDSIASQDTANTLTKSGSGTLVLNADNSYYQGAVNVTVGRLLLGNAGAKLGGTIVVSPGAGFGGSGTATGGVTVNAGSLQIGADGAAAQTLRVDGELSLLNGVALSYDYINGTGDLLSAGVLSIGGSGTNAVTLSGYQNTGVYTLARADSEITTFSAARFSAAGLTGRLAGNFSLGNDNKDLQITLYNGRNYEVRWTGAAGAAWDGALVNWSGTGAGDVALDTFMQGDRVVFDSVADAAQAGRRSIAVGAGVTVADLLVSGTGDYTFTGNGAISASAAHVSGMEITGAGKLIKDGAGTLRFDNAANSFAGGVELAGGVLAVSSTAQLGAALGDVVFSAPASGGGARLALLGGVVFDGGGAAAARVAVADGRAGGLDVAAGQSLVITRNTVGGGQGGALNVGGGVADSAAWFALTGSGTTLFSSNTAGAGGAIYNTGSVALTNVSFQNNTATANGGAIYNAGSLSLDFRDDAGASGNTGGGGFLYMEKLGAAAPVATVSVADGKIFTAGVAGAASDGIASATADAIINKTGGGVFITHADNRGFSGQLNVQGGSFILTATGGGLGGNVSVAATAGGAAPVLFGGAGTVAGNVTVGAGSTLQAGVDGAGAAQSLTVGGTLTLDSAILKFGIHGGDANGRIVIGAGGALVATGTQSINIDRLITGMYNLGNIGGAYIAGMPVLVGGQAIGGGGRQTAAVSVSGGDLLLDIDAGISAEIRWTSAYSGTWNLDRTRNWTNGAEMAFAFGDKVIFDSTADAAGTGGRDIKIDGDRVVVSDLEVSGGENYTFTGAGIEADKDSVGANPAMAAAAQGKLIKSGTGTLTLANSGENNFKGGLYINEGVLALASAGALGASNVVIGGAGAIIQTADADVTARGGLDLAGHGATVDVTGNLAWTGVVSGAAGIIKTGTGTLALSGSNTFSGGVLLRAGALALGGGGASGASSGTLSVGGEGVEIRAGDGVTVANAVDLGGFGARLAVPSGAAAFSGVIGGAGDIEKTGNGTLELAGVNIQTGTLKISAGAVRAATMDSLGAASAGVYIDGLGRLELAPAAAGALVFDRALAGQGALAVTLADEADQFAFGAAAGTAFQGTVQMNSGVIALDAGAASALGGATLQLNAGSLAKKAGGDFIINALGFNGGTLELAMNGAVPDGLLTVATLNTGAGVNTIKLDTAALLDSQANPAVPPQPSLFEQDSAGAVRLIGAGSINGTGSFRIVGLDGALLPLAPATSFVDIFQDGGAEAVARAGYNYTAFTRLDGVWFGYGLTELEVLAGKTLVLDNAASSISTLAAVISGSGGVEVRAAEGRPVVLNSANSYTGETAIATGILRLGVADALAASKRIYINEGAAMDMNHLNQRLQNLSGAGSLTLGTGTATLDNDDDSAFTGAISGDGGIIKTGAGVLTLAGRNPYKGGTIIEAGRLVAGGAGSLGASTGAVTLLDHAVLEFNGASGVYRNNLFADAPGSLVEVTAGRFSLSGTASRVARMDIRGEGTIVYAAHAEALGGAGAEVTVRGGAALEAGAAGVKAGVLTFDGGVLSVAAGEKPGTFATGALTFTGGAGVSIAGSIPGGHYVLAESAAAIVGTPSYETLQHGMYVNVAALPNEVVLTVVNRDVEPSREVVSSFDLLHRVTDAVHAHIAGVFFEPMVGRNAEAFYRNGRLAASNGPANASNLWLRGLGSLLKRRAGDGQAGYEENSYGVLTGYDRAFGRRLLLGAYGAAVRGRTMTDNRAETRTDSQLLGAYGSVRFGRAYLSAEITAGYGKADTDRREGDGSARAAYDRAHAGASMELGMVLAEWEGGLLKPAAAVHYMRTKFDAQREYGPGAMYIPGFSEDLVQSYITLQAGQRFTLPWGWRGVADLTIGFRQNLTDPGSTVNAAFVAAGEHAAVIPVRTIADDYWQGGVTGGLGVRFIMGPDSTWGLRATCESSARQQQYNFGAFVNFMW